MSMPTPVPAVAPDNATAAWQASGSLARLTLAGHVNAHTLGNIWHRIRTQQADWLTGSGNATPADSKPVLTIDLAQIGYLDGAGIAFLIDLQHAQQRAGGSTELCNLDARYQPLMAQYQPFDNLYPPPVSNHRPHTSLIERIGKATEAVADDVRHQVVFIGQLASNLGWAFRNPVCCAGMTLSAWRLRPVSPPYRLYRWWRF